MVVTSAGCTGSIDPGSPVPPPVVTQPSVPDDTAIAREYMSQWDGVEQKAKHVSHPTVYRKTKHEAILKRMIKAHPGLTEERVKQAVTAQEQGRGKSQEGESEPQDDLTLFISKYGPPDSEYSSENEVPRPLIVTRWLIYKKESVRAVYHPDAPVGSSPPYEKWKLFGFQNQKTNAVIKPAQVVKLMAHRER